MIYKYYEEVVRIGLIRGRVEGCEWESGYVYV